MKYFSLGGLSIVFIAGVFAGLQGSPLAGAFICASALMPIFKNLNLRPKVSF